jgi:hypothetical protein
LAAVSLDEGKPTMAANGSLTSLLARLPNVCYSPDSGEIADISEPPLGAHKRKSRFVVDLAREQQQQLMLGSVKIDGAGFAFAHTTRSKGVKLKAVVKTWTNARPRHRERIAARSIVDAQTTLFQLEISSGRGRQSGNHIDEG